MLPILIAHRCGPDIYPEQSIASARHALKQGANMVEMDVRYTLDGQPIISHDSNAERVFGVNRPCEDMTLAEFMAMRHAADRSYAAHSLMDVLSVKDVRPLLLHCKITGEHVRDLTERLAACGAQKECVLGVESAEDVDVARSACREISVLAFMPGMEHMPQFLKSNCQLIRLWEAWVTGEAVEKIHGAGKKVWIMAGPCTMEGVGHTSRENMMDWMEMGVDGILINDVSWARRIIR